MACRLRCGAVHAEQEVAPSLTRSLSPPFDATWLRKVEGLLGWERGTFALEAGGCLRLRGHSLGERQEVAIGDGDLALLTVGCDALYTAAVTERPHLIVIDEVELHLHPKQQVGLLDRLRTTFPSSQIIVSTKSPTIITEAQRDEWARVVSFD